MRQGRIQKKSLEGLGQISAEGFPRRGRFGDSYRFSVLQNRLEYILETKGIVFFKQ